MNARRDLAIVGSGPSALYLLKHLLDEPGFVKEHLRTLTIFEGSSIAGCGMPYHPLTTDRYSLSNISSEEIPDLPMSFATWLRTLEPAHLVKYGLKGDDISESEIYSRLAVGGYLRAQYRTLLDRLAQEGLEISEFVRCHVIDIEDNEKTKTVILTTQERGRHEFAKVVVATGHFWPAEDNPTCGYFASPWPIRKLLPPPGEVLNFAIGTLGASLSAFDVVSSLAHRHGRFVTKGGQLNFLPDPGTENFKITMHSSEGMLPHLQFDQEEPLREIYRHVSREDLLALVDERGFLRIDIYFDKACRPVLKNACEKDGLSEVASRLADSGFGLKNFIENMADSHDYPDAFEGMRKEMVEAEEFVRKHRPMHWKETMDDLIFTLNFHAELMPAEDHLFLSATLMPFQMNVVAAMPLRSGYTILALHDAGKLDIRAGKVSIAEQQEKAGMTTVIVEDGGEETKLEYRVFVDCRGQKPLETEDYPFPTLVKDGTIRRAHVAFAEPTVGRELVPEDKKDHLVSEQGRLMYQLVGLDIDPSYRVVGRDGVPNPRIHDIAGPHTSGLRPYSNGLQACSATAQLVVRSWLNDDAGNGKTGKTEA